MILPQTKVPFDQLASEASQALFTDGTPLNDSVVKIAQRESLNPEETKRLVEKTNTLATLTMLKAAADKKAEIFLAEADTVLDKTHFAKPEVEKTASASTSFFNIPDLRTLDRIKDVKLHPGIDKTAAAIPKKLTAKTAFTASQKIQELTQKKFAEEIKVKDSIDFIISEFSKMRAPDFGKFAEEVYTIYGEPSLGVLSKIAEITRDKMPDEMEKVASIIDDSTMLHKKYAQINQGIVNIIMLDNDLTSAKKEYLDFWNSVKQ